MGKRKEGKTLTKSLGNRAFVEEKTIKRSSYPGRAQEEGL